MKSEARKFWLTRSTATRAESSARLISSFHSLPGWIAWSSHSLIKPSNEGLQGEGQPIAPPHVFVAVADQHLVADRRQHRCSCPRHCNGLPHQGRKRGIRRWAVLHAPKDVDGDGRLTVAYVRRDSMSFPSGYLGAIDQGTSSTRFIIFDDSTRIVAESQSGARADLSAARLA